MPSLIRRAFVTALLLASTATPALAEDHPDPFESMQNPKRLLRGAMLTEAQVAQIRELRKGQIEQEKEIQTKLRVMWDSWDDEFTSTEALDPAAFVALFEEARQLQEQSEHAKVLVMLQMRALLTPEQLARVSEAHQKSKALNSQLHELPATIAAESGK